MPPVHVSSLRSVRRACRISRTPDRDDLALVIGDIHVDNADRLAIGADTRSRVQGRLDGGPQVVDAEIDGREWTAKQHRERIVPNRVDHGCDWTAVPLPGAADALELGAHLEPHRNLARGTVSRHNFQAQEADECRATEHALDLFASEGCRTHGLHRIRWGYGLALFSSQAGAVSNWRSILL